MTPAWWVVASLVLALGLVCWKFYCYRRSCLKKLFGLSEHKLSHSTQSPPSHKPVSEAEARHQVSLEAEVGLAANVKKNVKQRVVDRLLHTVSQQADPFYAIYIKIIKVLATEALLKDPELDVSKLADHIGSNQKYVSQAIAKFGAEGGYYELINHHRTLLAIRLLQGDCEQIKISTIAYECGFSCRSTFYSAFRHMTGMTPIEYRQQWHRIHSIEVPPKITIDSAP